MASPQAPEKFTANNKVTMYDFDPDTTNATDVAWVDMQGYEELTVICMASALTGAGVDAFKIVGNSDSAGGDTDVDIKSHAVGDAPDAVGDYLVLSITAEQMVQEGADGSQTDLRYATAILEVANTADENVVTYIRSRPQFAVSGLTADTVA